MMNFNFNKISSLLLSLAFLFCLSFGISQKAMAQDFEFQECVTPDGHNFAYFVDTLQESMYLAYYADNTGNTTLFSLQDEFFTQIPNPENTSFFQLATSTEDDLFLIYGDPAFFGGNLYRYDGVTMTYIPGAEDFTFSYFVTALDGDLYFAFYDINFNTHLFQYDGTTLNQIPSPDNYIFGGVVGDLNDELFLIYYENFGFTSTLFSYDGSDLEELALPEGWTFSWVPFTTEDAIFINMYDTNFENGLFEFDGSTFTEFENPDGLIFSNFVTETDDGEYFLAFYDNINFDQFLYIYDGTNLEEVPNQPAAPFNGYITSKNDKYYFSYGDWGDLDLYEYDGTDFTLISGEPDDLSFGYFVGELESTCYFVYWDVNFNGNLVQMQNGMLNAIPTPTNTSFNQLFTEEDGFVFMTYYDINTFQANLYVYDGENTTEIPIPTGFQINTFVAEFENNLFFSFYDQNTFNNFLYKIELNQAPSSANNTVYVSEDETFYFSDTDFTFIDEDVSDVLSGIQMVTQVDKGVIHLNGAVINVGDIIPDDELDLLIFVPLPGETGDPYTSFDFRVFDGDDLSEETYTMFIVVGDFTATTEQNIFASIKMYPNPTTNFLQVDLESRENLSIINLSVYSTAGKLISEEQISSFGLQTQHTLDVSNLPNGQYILRIVANDQITGSSFIKQ